ncbi:MAG: hypothetical protein AAF997_02505 [Myxococcota bacterium]
MRSSKNSEGNQPSSRPKGPVKVLQGGLILGFVWACTLTLFACGDAPFAAPPATPCDGLCGPNDLAVCPSDCASIATGGTGGAAATLGEGGAGGVSLLPGECLTREDCGPSEVCLPPGFDGVRGDAASTEPGLCDPEPPIRRMALVAVAPVTFTEDGYVEESGTFSINILADAFVFGTRRRIDLWSGIEYPGEPPFESYSLQSMYRYSFVIRVASEDATGFLAACRLSFGPTGDLLGGVTPEPGRALCSGTSQQLPGDAGLLVDFEYYCTRDVDCPAYVSTCNSRRCVVPEPAP